MLLMDLLTSSLAFDFLLHTQATMPRVSTRGADADSVVSLDLSLQHCAHTEHLGPAHQGTGMYPSLFYRSDFAFICTVWNEKKNVQIQ
jgi:hypothetical protein